MRAVFRSVAGVLISGAVAGCATTPDTVRILTYNTGLLYLQADHPSVPPTLPPCGSCDPFPFTYTGTPCACFPSATFEPNRSVFADVPEAGAADSRARRIAQLILDSQQQHDIVLLNEVFHPEAKDEIVEVLSGRYPHYVKTLAGMPRSGLLKVSDLVQQALGHHIPPFPFVSDYDAVPQDSGLMVFSKYRFLPLEGDDVVNDADGSSIACQQSPGVCKLEGGNLQGDMVAFRVYPNCTAEDCWASKGVGLVKVNTPVQASYVAFTHMQADYPDAGRFFPAVRAGQYETIMQLIEGSIPGGELPNAAVFVGGDLNTPGFSRLEPPTSRSREWHDVYDPATTTGNDAMGFFACGNGVTVGSSVEPCLFRSNGTRFLTDGWGFQTSPSDPGVTNDVDGVRLDYLLHSPVDGILCMQHAHIAWDLFGETWLSDHLPLRGDYLLRGDEYCTANDDPSFPQIPFLSLELEFGPVDCDNAPADTTNADCDTSELVQGLELGAAGSMHWFRITQAGTYSINHFTADPDKNVSHVVYAHDNLSEPIAAFKEDGLGERESRGATYSMPFPPYYVRVFAADTSGAHTRTERDTVYDLLVLQHLCRSPADACVLDPAVPYEHPWPTTDGGSLGGPPGNPLTDIKQLWWTFKASGIKDRRLVGPGIDGTAYPKVEIQMEANTLELYGCIADPEPAGDPVIEVYDDHHNPVVLTATRPFVSVETDPGDHDHDHDGKPDDYRLAPPLDGATDEFAHYFLRVSRPSDLFDPFEPCNAGLTSTITYRTDLSYFAPQDVRMALELDDDLGAADQMRLYSGLDEAGWINSVPLFQSVRKEFDQPLAGTFTPYWNLRGFEDLKGYYLSRVFFNFWEEDEERHLLAVDAHIEPFRGAIPGLAPVLVDDHGEKLFADVGNRDEADYWYELRYALCHEHDSRACRTPGS